MKKIQIDNKTTCVTIFSRLYAKVDGVFSRLGNNSSQVFFVSGCKAKICLVFSFLMIYNWVSEIDNIRNIFINIQ